MGRGRSAKSDALVEAAYEILEQVQPCTVRGVCYQLFIRGVIPSMATNETQKVSRNLVYARENDIIPWEWIVDETREAERPGTWTDPKSYAEAVIRSYRRDRWESQPATVEVWSEKGTIRGILAPTLEEYGVTFRVFHGFNSATVVREIAAEVRTKPLIAFYVGDWDPSGLYMSDIDLPQRLERYGADLDNIKLMRLALTGENLHNLPSFPAKKTDPRYRWFAGHTGQKRAWELDAMDPRELRGVVEQAILGQINLTSWERMRMVEEVEHDSLVNIIGRWPTSISRQVEECAEGRE